ncbi:hypothetical protein AB3X52_10500 [Nocardioides sp. DS6]|uniref:Uncharacterized protein n=1 Tax=Nocardioides eburneus TaxID=3231482 RepID=A0ABV3SYM5_9ACTN
MTSSEEPVTGGPAADRPAHDGRPARRPAEPEWKRRQRLARIFGDVLPDTTRDERDADSRSRDGGESASDAWLKSQVPPHHGG